MFGILAVHAPSALAQDQVTDCASNTSTVCNLSVSGNNSGEIGVDDVDWFMVRLNADITYRFDVRGNESTDPGGTLNYPQVAVINLGGSTILTRDYNSRNAGSARINFIPAANATYYIQVSGNEANGTYTVSANSISGNRPPVIDNTLSHNLQEHGVMNLSLNSWDLDSSDNVESYELDGPDADHFSINQSTGILSLNIEPDFERPVDLDEDNVYEFDVRVHSGTGQRNLSFSKLFVLTITDNDSEAPGPPRNFKVARVTLNKFYLEWDHPAANKGPDRESYTISIGAPGYSNLLVKIGRGKKQYNALLDLSSKVFKLKLRAENAEGESDWVVIPALRIDECDQSKSTKCSLDIGENKTGWMNTDWYTAPDIDWFSVDLQAGTNYQIDVKGNVLGDNGGTLNDPAVRFRNSSGGEVARDDNSGTGNNAQLSYTPIDTGTYYVDVRGEGVNSGNDPRGEGRTYTVSVNLKPLGCPSDTDTSSNLSIGGSQTGEVYFYEFDCFRVMLQANTTYRFDVRGNESTDPGGTLNYPRVAVFDSSGGIIVRDYNSGMANSARVNFRPSYVGGTYYVKASGNGVSGTYTISATEISGNSPPEIIGDRRLTIEEHGMLNHTLTFQDSDSSDNIEGYELDGPDADHFSINQSTGILSLNIEPDFERPEDLDENNVYEFDVRVHSGTGQRNLSSSAVFTLNITDNNSEVPGPPRNFKVARVTLNRYYLEWDHPAVNKGPDREKYILRLYPPGYRARTRHVSPNSNSFQSSSDNFNSYHVSIRTRTAEGESDWVVIPALRLDKCDHSNSTKCSLDIGENKTGWMNTDWYTAPDIDWFSVDLQAGTNYQIDVKGKVSGDNGGTLNDPAVRLRNSSGGEVARDDNSGTGNNAQLSYTPIDTGTYYVDVRGEGVNSGNDPRGEGRSYTISVKLPTFCDRTAQVRDAILETISSTDCSAVNSTQLAGIQSLNLTSKNIRALKEGDFDNLTGLTFLYLNGNNLSSLPEGIFDGLTNLETLSLGGNGLVSLPDGVFDGLTNLGDLDLSGNNLSVLPSGVFDDLTLLGFLNLEENNLTSLPEGIFDDLTLLGFLNLEENNLTSLPEGIFDDLTSLFILYLNGNNLSSLPEGVFDDLTGLTSLKLSGNNLTSLPEGVFDDLTGLISLNLEENNLTSLPEGVFGNLTSLLFLSTDFDCIPSSAFGSRTDDLHGITHNNEPLIICRENNPPVFSQNSYTFSLDENEDGSSIPVFLGRVSATDDDNDKITHSITQGNTNKFSINSSTGELKYVGSGEDYETLITYTLGVGVSDGITNTTVNVIINIRNLNDNYPEFNESSYTFHLDENEAGSVIPVPVGRVSATDLDNLSGLNYSISAGNTNKFSIEPATGEIAYTGSGEDYESGTTQYNLTVQASEGITNTTASVIINVNDTYETIPNNSPFFSSNSTFSVQENRVVVGTVVASDSDSEDSVTGYSISGGVDGSLFTITDGGVLTFRSAPNFENPSDTGGDNGYDLVVTATSGTGSRELSATQRITVSVTDLNNEVPSRPSAPTLSSPTPTSLLVSWSAPLNTGPSITDYDVGYGRSSNGPFGDWPHTDASRSTTIPDLNASTLYYVRVLARNAEGASGWSEVSNFTTRSASPPPVTNGPPVFTSNAAFSVNENSRNVGTVVAYDPDPEDSIVGYFFHPSMDRELFDITNEGVLTFVSAPDFERPWNSSTGYYGGNRYSLFVYVYSGSSDRRKESAKTFTVSVTDVDEPPSAPDPPVLSSVNSTSLFVEWSAPDNTGPVVTDYDVQYREGTTGPFSDWSHSDNSTNTAITGRDTETLYQVRVRASSDEGTGDWSDAANVTTSVLPNAAPAFSSASSFSVAENVAVVGTVVADDSDSQDDINGYSISGGDESLFELTNAGVLSFKSAPDFEVPGGDNGDRDYVVEVTVMSGSGGRELSATQTVTVTVDDVDEPPSAPETPDLSPFNGPSLFVEWSAPDNTGPRIIDYDVQYKENSSRVFLNWTHNSINTGTRIDNLSEETVYNVRVRATNDEGTGDWSETANATTPTGPNEYPAFSSDSVFSVPENTRAVGTVVADDSDSQDDINGYSISGGDESLFELTNAGVLSFKSAPDFEVPGGDNGDRDYVVEVTVTSGTGNRELSWTQYITVNVNDVDEPPSRPSAPALRSLDYMTLFVEWSAPDNNGGPYINDYDVEYKKNTDSFFTDWPHTGNVTNTTITDLNASTLYYVRVLARNAEGNSSWSPVASFTTRCRFRTIAPAFSSASTFFG